MKKKGGYIGRLKVFFDFESNVESLSLMQEFVVFKTAKGIFVNIDSEDEVGTILNQIGYVATFEKDDLFWKDSEGRHYDYYKNMDEIKKYLKNEFEIFGYKKVRVIFEK
ncbi:MAG: hypothetical protein ACTSV7_15075 [Candidatus Baldrarchaeia archaeon]